MRVLHVNDVANVARTLVEGLARLGVKGRLLKPGLQGLPGPGGGLVEPLEAKHRVLLLPKVYRRIVDGRRRWDILHVHYLRSYTYIASTLDTPYLVHVHGSDARLMHSKSIYENRIHAGLKRYALRHASMILVSTPDLLNIVKAHARGKEVKYLPNPIDTSAFSPTNGKALGERFRNALGGALIVSLPTSIDFEAKGSHLFLKALARAEKPEDLKVLYLERGRDTADFRRLASKLGLGRTLIPLKPLPHNFMPGLYGTSDIVVGALTPRRVFGVTALEAMACGKATLNTWSPAFYGRTGFEPLSPHVGEIAAQLEELLHSSRSRRTWAKAQHGWVASNHGQEKVAAQLLGFYRELLRDAGNR